jgi:hypothetical protein
MHQNVNRKINQKYLRVDDALLHVHAKLEFEQSFVQGETKKTKLACNWVGVLFIWDVQPAPVAL